MASEDEYVHDLSIFLHFFYINSQRCSNKALLTDSVSSL